MKNENEATSNGKISFMYQTHNFRVWGRAFKYMLFSENQIGIFSLISLKGFNKLKLMNYQ